MPGLENWSVGKRTHPARDELVFFAPYDDDLPAAFSAARRWLGTSTNVRIIGRGATRPTLRPAWSLSWDRLVLTEVDAYLPENRVTLLSPLIARAREWVRLVFGGIGGPVLEQAIWATVANRLLLMAFDAWPLAIGLARAHASQTVFCSRPDWIALEGLKGLLDEAGGRLLPATRPTTAPRLVLSTVTAAAMVASTALRALEFTRERAALARLRLLQNTESPDVWVGAIAGSVSGSRQSIAAAQQLAALNPAARIGVLLQGHLEDTSAGFPSLAQLQSVIQVSAVDQVIAAENAAERRKVLQEFTEAAPALLARLNASRGGIDLGPITVPIDPRNSRVLRTFSIDVVRTLEAGVATRAAVARHDFKGRAIVWPHASLSNMAAPDLLLQSAGARTIELVHGAFSEPIDAQTYAASHSTYRISWSLTEASSLQPFVPHQRCIGGLSTRLHARHLEAREPRCRILLLSNYAHGFGTQSKDRPNLAGYQEHLLAALAGPLTALANQVDVRWRPHPHDDPGEIKTAFQRSRDFIGALSPPGATLVSDLEWANVVISSWSSTIIEALEYPVAIFLHKIPLLDPVGVVASFDESRTFESEAQVAVRLGDCVARWKALDPDWTSAEDHLRRLWFGPTGVPAPFADFLLSASRRA